MVKPSPDEIEKSIGAPLSKLEKQIYALGKRRGAPMDGCASFFKPASVGSELRRPPHGYGVISIFTPSAVQALVGTALLLASPL